MKKQILKISLFLLMFFVLPNCVRAAEYYVATTGSDANTGSIDNPWLTPTYGAAHVASGDTLYIRGGTYDVVTPNNNSYSGVAPHADDVTIAGYPGETAILRGNNGVSPTNCVIGNGYSSGGDHFRNNLTIDNLTIEGMVSMVYASGITFKNSHASIGGDSWSGNLQGAVVWVQGCTNCNIQNNIIEGSYNAPGGSRASVAVYVATNLLIENNNITNSATGGQAILLKDSVVGANVRYNYIHDTNGAGIWTANQANAGEPSGIAIYQNIFSNTNTSHMDDGAITFAILTTNTDVYNNTFYGNYYDYFHQNSTTKDWRWFNNISYANKAQFFRIPYSGDALSFTLLDYNSYSAITPRWVLNPSTYSSLTAWQAACGGVLSGCETHSTTTDPDFINASGLFNTPADFKRISYESNGRGGIYSDIMGAYITGDEVIGFTSGSSSDTTAPAAPSGLSVM